MISCGERQFLLNRGPNGVRVRAFKEQDISCFLERLAEETRICRCKNQMDVLIQMQVYQRMEQSLQQRSVCADEQAKMNITT